MDKLIEKLQKNIVNSNSNKSSYWKKYLKETTNYTDIFNPDIGVGKFKKKNYYFVHQLLLRLINFPFIRKYDGNHKHCLVKFS